jgi:hypothetical protein
MTILLKWADRLLATVARRASEGHKDNHSTGSRAVVVSLACMSDYRCFRQLPLFEYASATSKLARHATA